MSSASDKHGLRPLGAGVAVRPAGPPVERSARRGGAISACPDCRQEMETLRPVVDSFVSWPTDVLRPSASLWGRLAQRIAAETGGNPCCRRRSDGRNRNGKKSRLASPASCSRPIRRGTASACWCGSRRESTIRLTRHAGVEELHLLDGELWIDDRKLYPGDYNRAEPGTADHRVWSETGCTCVLITSTRDVLR